MLLDATTDNLEVILDKAVTANNITFGVFYNEYTSTTVTPKKNVGGATGAAGVNLIPAPSAGNQRQLRWCSINNVDTNDMGVKVRFNDNGSYRNVLYVYLRVGESIQYSEEMGWRVYDNTGSERVAGFNRLPSSIRTPEWFYASGVASAQSLTSGYDYCIYLGKVDRPYSSIQIRYNVTTAASTITWAEVAIYKGNFSLQTNASLTRIGFTDISGVVNSTGNKTTTITTSGLVMNDDIWAVFACNSSGALALRSGVAETLGVGYVQVVSSVTRPSTNLTISPTISTVVTIPWIAYQHFYQGT